MNPQSAYEHRTEKLYETDGLLIEFDAEVISCDESDGIFFTELDRTVFFPEGGGQESDTGSLEGIPVTFVGIKDGRILHYTDRAFSVGDRVHGIIDARQRRRRMQHHGGEHIISGLIHSLYGIENAGFHMSENEITIDTAAPLTAEMLETVELKANEAIWENRKINCYYPTPEELSALEYRSKTALSGDVRIVEIEGYDRCACCAPHLAYTGQIGIIKIKSFIKYKKGVRITVAAGEDALNNYKVISQNAAAIARLYSVQSEEISDAVLRREEQFSAKLTELHELKESLLSEKLKAIEPTDGNICVFEDGCDSNLLKKLANDGAALAKGVFAAFSDNGRGGYNYVVVSSAEELSPLAASMRQSLGGRGGGKGTMISGFVEADRETVENFFNQKEAE